MDQDLDVRKLKRLGHVLRMSPDRLLGCALLDKVDRAWSGLRGGQSMSWTKANKQLASELSRVGSLRLPGWGSRDPLNLLLETLTDTAKCRDQ